MGTAEWETLGPRHVCEQIKSLKLLGYRELPYSEHPPLLPPAAAPQVGTLQGASTQSQRLKIFGNLPVQYTLGDGNASEVQSWSS